jgi:hypothetical protein
MPQQDLIDNLIGTYRTLNMRVRPLDPASAAQLTAGGTTLREMLLDLRNQELAASQALKNMTLADSPGTAGMLPSDIDILPPAEDATVRVLLSEFGTAREAILALIRELSDEQWAEQRTGPDGSTTIQSYVQALADRDKQLMSQVDAMIPARS